MLRKILMNWVFLNVYNLAMLDVNIFTKFHQNDYDVKDWKAISTGFNKQFFSDFSVITFRFNRTTRAINFTIESLIDIDKDSIKGSLQAYKRIAMRSIEFPIFIELKVCELLEYNVLGLAHFDCGSLTCPFYKNVRQHGCNWIPDFSRLPPLIPDGEYVIKLNFTYDQQYALSFDWYGVVYRKPFKNFQNISVKQS